MASFRPTSTHYKLCAKVGDKLYCYTDRTKEMSLFMTITQSLDSGKNLIFVYPTAESCLSESSETSRPSFSNSRPYPKTIVKILCMGEQRQLDCKSAFSSMTVMEEVALPFASNPRSMMLTFRSHKKPFKGKQSINPLFQTKKKIYLDVRVNNQSKPRYKSSSGRNYSETRAVPSGSSSRPYTNLKSRLKSPEAVQRSFMDSVYQKFRIIKKEMQWLDGEVKYLENMRKFAKLENVESIMSSLDLD